MTKRAFTLIELLVVIAIIAILAAILFPVFAQAKLAAKKTADLSNMKQIGTSIQLYLGDSDDTYPQGYWYNNDNNSNNGYTQWSGAIEPYVKNLQIFVSPGDPTGGLAPTNFIGNNRGYGVPAGQTSQNPAIQDNQAPRLSYIANSLLLPRKRRTIDPMNVIGSTVVDEVAETILLAEMTNSPKCINDSSTASGVAFKTHRSMNSIKLSSGTRFQGEDPTEIGNAYYYTVTPAEAATRWDDCKGANTLPDAQKFHIGYIQPDRFTGGSNYTFADGHSKFFKPEATLNPEKYQWGKKAYTAGGGIIRNPVNDQPVK